jgi:hypothetical protein
MVVTGQLHAMGIFPSGKENLVTVHQKAGWAPELSWKFGGRENLVPLLGFEPWIIQPIA